MAILFLIYLFQGNKDVNIKIKPIKHIMVLTFDLEKYENIIIDRPQ